MDIESYETMYKLEKNYWWFVGRRKIISNLLKKIFPGKIDNALDVGCGTGFNMRVLSKYSRNVCGFESSKHIINYADTQIKSSIIYGKFPDINIKRKYDLITFFDVLEHIEDDATALHEAYNLLKPGGVIMITVPAFQSLWTKHDEMYHHYRRYNSKQLKNMISSLNGLRIERISYFNFILFPFIYIFRIVKKHIKYDDYTSDFYRYPPIINSLLTAVLAIEAFLIKFIQFPFGLSLICTIRKIK